MCGGSAACATEQQCPSSRGCDSLLQPCNTRTTQRVVHTPLQKRPAPFREQQLPPASRPPGSYPSTAGSKPRGNFDPIAGTFHGPAQPAMPHNTETTATHQCTGSAPSTHNIEATHQLCHALLVPADKQVSRVGVAVHEAMHMDHVAERARGDACKLAGEQGRRCVRRYNDPV